MFHWNTKDIVRDLRRIKGVESVASSPPGGDVDTDNVVVHVNGSPDSIWVCGFMVDGYITNPSGTEVEMIQITDGLESGGGLVSKCPHAAMVYIHVRQYFIDKGASVVDSMSDYF